MGIFNGTFRQHIIDELNFRKSREARQQVYHPTARVTALVEGNLNGEQLRGFTLGIPDTNLVKSLDQMTNIDGRGTVVGITYNESTPREVRVDSKINLPSPGVTDITISTQSKGGLVFKATVNFKFYGKEQYDFIYQTFMRPGNPILIEYGHTRTAESVSNFNDLGFFKNLDDTTPFENDIKQVSRLPAGRSDGRVAGLVSNFKISLNENNEYEGSIDIINALEFIFNLPPEDTFLSYKDNEFSDSIKNNFGYSEDEEYDPEYDRIFQLVQDDIPDNYAELNSYANHILSSTEIKVKTTVREIQLDGSLILGGGQGPGEQAAQAGASLAGIGIDETIEASLISLMNQTDSNFVWVSLNYVLDRLLPYILKRSVIYKDGSYQTLVGTAAQIKDYSEGKDFISNIIGRRAARNRLRESSQEAFENLLPDTDAPIFLYEPIGHWSILRSNNTKNVIINNKNLYTTYIKTSREDDYKEKFETEEFDSNKFFKIEPSWEFKEQYGTVSEEDFTKVKNSGIFINYQKVRNAFINSKSIAEAVTRLLTLINNSTNGVLNLKMKNISIDEGDSEIFKIVIYDENKLPTQIQDIYNFFEDDLTEAISYNFDFSLPSSVASTVLANSFNTGEKDVVGDAASKQLIDNGYDGNIISMISPSSEEIIRPTEPKLKSINIFRRDKSRRKNGVNSEPSSEEADTAIENYFDKIGEVYSSIIGYQEIVPPGMKSQIIRSGLFNTLPTSAKISIKLNGLDGFRFGDMFTVRNMLPSPYDENNIFMLTGYKHDISSDNWITTIDGIMIASTPEEKRPPQLSENVGTALLPGVTPDFEPFLPAEKDLSTLSSTLRQIVEEVKTRLPTTGFGVDGSLGLEMVVISARRSPQENARAGGSENSRHLTGHAVDIQLFEKTLLPTASYRVLTKPQFIGPSNGYQTRQKTAYVAVAQIFKQVASEANPSVSLRWGALESWGGDFSTLQDPNHFDIPTSLP